MTYRRHLCSSFLYQVIRDTSTEQIQKISIQHPLSMKHQTNVTPTQPPKRDMIMQATVLESSARHVYRRRFTYTITIQLREQLFRTSSLPPCPTSPSTPRPLCYRLLHVGFERSLCRERVPSCFGADHAPAIMCVTRMIMGMM